MKYYFVGIKGSGMSALACILHDLGNVVQGSDFETHFFTEKNLNERNIKIDNFGLGNLDDVDVVIVGNSFDSTNVDYARAQERNLKIKKYYEALNELVEGKNSIAVAGANGKTTTTGLLVTSMRNLSVSYLIGDGKGKGCPDSQCFIFEACEYKGTFLNYFPNIGIINNIEFDHPDFFRDIKHMIETFQGFANNSKTLIINGDDANCKEIEHKDKYTFGFGQENDLYAKDIKLTSLGMEFELVYKNESLGEHSLPFYGEYMLMNSLGVILANLLQGQEINTVIENMSTFEGVDRRLSQTIISEENNIYLIDDYAHHPTSINATIKAIRQKFPNFEVVSIFQAHTKARETTFYKEFANELLSSDRIMIVETFKAVREKEDTINDELLVQKEIINLGQGQKIVDLSDIQKMSQDVIICLFGAGDIDLQYKDKILSMYS